MGQIDDFLSAQVGPQLLPGEQIMGFGCVRWPDKLNVIGTPERYEEWLATATNLRLILFKTENSGVFNILTVKPKPMNKETRVWWYQEIQQVQLGSVQGIGNGVFMSLVPYEPLGAYEGKARRYDMFPAAEGCDGHAQFVAQFRTWLQGQVAAGAFPMDEQRRAQIAAHGERLRQQAEQKRLAAEERARKAKAFVSSWRSWLPLAIAGVLLVSAAILSYFIMDSFESASRNGEWADKWEEELTEAKRCRAGGKKPAADCMSPAREKDAKRYLEEYRDGVAEGHLLGGVFAGLTALCALGSGGLVILYFVRRRKLAAAPAASSPIQPA